MNTKSSEKALAGRVAIVTGAAGDGIGYAYALRLAAEGARVVVNGRPGGSDPATVVDEIRAAGGEAVANIESVATIQGGKRLIEAALDSFGRIDILINNAGVIRPGKIFDVTEDEIDETFSVHFKGTAGTCMAVAPHLRKQRSGVILNTGSEAGLGDYGNCIYAAAKEAIAGFTRSIVRDLGPYGVRVNLIRPIAITRMSLNEKLTQLMDECEKGWGMKALEHFWVTRLFVDPLDLSTHHCADFVVWLCTDAAAHVNGRDFRVLGSEIGLFAVPFPARSIYRDGRWDMDSLTHSVVAQNCHAHLQNEYLPKEPNPEFLKNIRE
jgi:3-oxoacyl-[acyl-carrier protein] reductase